MQESPIEARGVLHFSTLLDCQMQQMCRPAGRAMKIEERRICRKKHRVRLAADLATPSAVTVIGPDGVTISSTPIALGLLDEVSGRVAIIASITNCTGRLI